MCLLCPIAPEKAAAPTFLLDKETCSCTKGSKSRKCACVKAAIPCKYCTCKECEKKIPANIREEHGIESSELEEKYTLYTRIYPYIHHSHVDLGQHVATLAVHHRWCTTGVVHLMVH